MGFSEPQILQARTPHALGRTLVASGIEHGSSGPKLDAMTIRLITRLHCPVTFPLNSQSTRIS